MNLRADFNTVIDTLIAESLGDVATFNAASIYGLFQNEFLAINGIESNTPVFIGKEADLAGAVHNNSIVILGATYLIRGVEPDGTGLVKLILQEQ